MAKKMKNAIPAGGLQQNSIQDMPDDVQKTTRGGISILSFRVQAIILAVIGFVFYCNTFQNEAAFDDLMAIVDNEYVQQGFAGIPAILTTDAYQSYLEHKGSGNQLAGGRYRPLSLISFAIEQQCMGIGSDENDNAKENRAVREMHERHVVNVALYILSIIVLLYFLRHIVFPRDPLLAFISVLLFAIHPVHTEVVANVKSRDEILSLLFILLTFINAFRYYDGRKMRDLVLGLLFFFLALLSKEYAATLIFLLPVSFYVFRSLDVRKSLMATLPYLVPFAIYLLMRFNAVSAAVAGADQNVLNNPYLYATPVQKIATEIMVLLDYLWLLIFPNVLAADYTYNQIPYVTFSNPAVLLSIAIYIYAAVVMFLLIKKREALGFAIAFYLINLALVSNIFFNIGAPRGDRLIYHSSLGFCMVIASLLYYGYKQIKQRSVANMGLAGVLVIIIVLCGVKTIARNNDWENNESLFLTDVKKVPNSALVNNNAAASCMSFAKKNKADVPVRNEWLQKAIGYFDKALIIYPGYTFARLNRGLCYFNLGKPDRALQDWDSVRRYTPNEQNLSKYLTAAGKYFYGQGRNYESKGNIDSAIIAYKKCVDATPEIPEAWYSLGVSYVTEGKQAEAKDALKVAMQLAPNSPEVKQAWRQVNVVK